MTDNENKKNLRIDCTKCMFYFVTWDPSAPKGCHYYNFKSQFYPSLVVFQASGERCLGYREKTRPKRS